MAWCLTTISHFMNLKLMAFCLTTPSHYLNQIQPMSTNHQWDLLTFTCGHFHMKCSRYKRYLAAIWVWKLLIQIPLHLLESSELLSTLYLIKFAQSFVVFCLVSSCVIVQGFMSYIYSYSTGFVQWNWGQCQWNDWTFIRKTKLY